MTDYKIVKIVNGVETELVLSNTDLSVILEALQVYENHLSDSEPYNDDNDNIEEYDSWNEDSMNYESFDNRLLQFIQD